MADKTLAEMIAEGLNDESQVATHVSNPPPPDDTATTGGETPDTSTQLPAAGAEGEDKTSAADDAAATAAAATGVAGATFVDEQGRTRDAVTKKFVAAAPAVGADGKPVVAKPAVGADGKPVVAPVLGADGKPVVAPALGADGKPVVAKAKDPVNDPIPAGLKQETHERMAGLIETVKTVSGERDQLRQDLTLLVEPVRATGATPEQYQETLNVLTGINSPNVADQEAALEYLESAAAALAKRLGRVPAGQDPLAEHADLIQRVNGGTLTRKDAEDLAKARRVTAATTTRQQQQDQQRETAQQRQTSIRAGTQEVADIEVSFKELDPQFAQKDALLKADQAFRQELSRTHPSEWGAKYRAKYLTIKIAAPVQQQQQQAAPVKQVPLRTGAPAGGTPVGEPKSLLDAISAGM